MTSPGWLARWGGESVRRMVSGPVAGVTSVVTAAGVVAFVSDPGMGGWLLAAPSVVATLCGLAAVPFVKSGNDLVKQEDRNFNRQRNARARQFAKEQADVDRLRWLAEKERLRQMNESLHYLRQTGREDSDELWELEMEVEKSQVRLGWYRPKVVSRSGNVSWNGSVPEGLKFTLG